MKWNWIDIQVWWWKWFNKPKYEQHTKQMQEVLNSLVKISNAVIDFNKDFSQGMEKIMNDTMQKLIHRKSEEKKE